EDIVQKVKENLASGVCFEKLIPKAVFDSIEAICHAPSIKAHPSVEEQEALLKDQLLNSENRLGQYSIDLLPYLQGTKYHFVFLLHFLASFFLFIFRLIIVILLKIGIAT